MGATGLRVSVVGLGTWQLGGEWGRRFTEPEVTELVRAAHDSGMNLVDTAECYGDHLAETLVGRAIRGHRDEWVVATKFGHRFHPEAMGEDGWSPASVRSDAWAPEDVVAQLEASLRALATDYVDVYQFHSGTDEVVDRDDIWAVLADQVTRGKVRHLGVSLGGEDVHQAGRLRERGGGVVQAGYNRLDRSAEEAVLPVCRDHGLGVLVREPLANGFLSGRYRPGTGVTAANDWRAAQDPAEVRRKLELVEELRRAEVPDGVPMAAWAVAWCLRDPAVSAVVAGCKSVEQVRANAAAADLDLDQPVGR